SSFASSSFSRNSRSTIGRVLMFDGAGLAPATPVFNCAIALLLDRASRMQAAAENVNVRTLQQRGVLTSLYCSSGYLSLRVKAESSFSYATILAFVSMGAAASRRNRSAAINAVR